MKNKKWLYISWLPLMLLLWFLTPQGHPAWIKPTVFIIVLLVQAIIFWLFRKEAFQDKEDRYFGLTEKLYSMTIFAAFGIYTKGLWALTPNSNPIWLKHVFLGLGLLILVAFFLYFAFKKVDEKPDERFYADLARAACLTLTLILASLMILSVIAFFFPFTLTAGMVLIFGAVMILAFDIAFFVFEKRGA
ncbi:DUF3796 domain-containing protein [Streptococcus tangpeifui]|uniref:DUF3796 domain-containing protein n=1 Tax=Streptococcus tangpeifui TaxID=2709400 RepID=UPI0013EBE41F|nr:DUF3796 domain-containing protein [Streptococcus sp. ZJ373]